MVTLAGLYLNTARYLRWQQVWHRFAKPRRRLQDTGGLCLRQNSGGLVELPRRPPQIEAGAKALILNRTIVLDDPAVWNGIGLPRLWLYHLHYFDDLICSQWESRVATHRALIRDWMERNPIGQGAGWEPYCLSRRIVNWIKWHLNTGGLDKTAIDSLAVQCEHLACNLEFHLLGNHLFANAKALVFAGTFFEGARANEWRKLGLQLLADELEEQVLRDGGHFERSPMYHAIVLEDVCDLLNLARVAYPAVGRECDLVLDNAAATAARMLAWLRGMSHPDGDIGFFNDAALGVALPLRELWDYALRLGLQVHSPSRERVQWWPESGYARVESGPAVIILDMAPVGPDYQPGHAHADTLSFEMSLGERRVIVNSGTSLYESCQERLRQRSTAAHSTVEIDGRNSSEVWSSFRVARRARPFNVRIEESPVDVRISGAHDGYVRLAGGAVHHRRWIVDGHSLEIVDEVSGRFRSAVARYFFHPDARASGTGDSTGVIDCGSQHMTWAIRQGTGRLVDATYHPRFGVTQPSQCLEIMLTERAAVVSFGWLA